MLAGTGRGSARFTKSCSCPSCADCAGYGGVEVAALLRVDRLPVIADRSPVGGAEEKPGPEHPARVGGRVPWPLRELPRDRIAPPLDVADRARHPVIGGERGEAAVRREEEPLPFAKGRGHRVGGAARHGRTVDGEARCPSSCAPPSETRRRSSSAPRRTARLPSGERTSPSGCAPGSGRTSAASTPASRSSTRTSPLEASAEKRYFPSAEISIACGPATTSPMAPSTPGTSAASVVSTAPAPVASTGVKAGKAGGLEVELRLRRVRSEKEVGHPGRARSRPHREVEQPSRLTVREPGIVAPRPCPERSTPRRCPGPPASTVVTPGPSRCDASSRVPSALQASAQGLRATLAVAVTVNEATSTFTSVSSLLHATYTDPPSGEGEHAHRLGADADGVDHRARREVDGVKLPAALPGDEERRAIAAQREHAGRDGRRVRTFWHPPPGARRRARSRARACGSRYREWIPSRDQRWPRRGAPHPRSARGSSSDARRDLRRPPRRSPGSRSGLAQARRRTRTRTQARRHGSRRLSPRRRPAHRHR